LITTQFVFAEEDPTIISVNIIGESEIYPYSESKMIRADVEIENYTPSHGYYFMRISNSDGIIKETEIYPTGRGNDLWGTQVAYMVTSETPDTFTILIFSETGTATGTATFSLLKTKLITEPADEELLPTELSKPTQQIPDWVRNIFIWYAEGEIGEEELIGALQFLIKEGIIEV